MDKTMNKNIRINIKYTLKDFRDFSFVKAYGSVLSKIMLIPLVLFILLMIICIPFIIIAFYKEPLSAISMLLMFFPIIIIPMIGLLPFLTTYLVQRNNFAKSKLLQSLQCLEVSKDEFVITSIEGRSSTRWDEIHKVHELRTCFLFYLSPFKAIIVPRRCFLSQEQLDDFANILRSSIQKKKLKLKNYKLKKSSPDFGEVEVMNESVSLEEYDMTNVGESPEVTVKFLLEKKDWLSINYMLYYTSPAGIVLTLLGIMLIFGSIRGIVSGENYPFLVSLLPGLVLTFFVPLMLLINSNRIYSKDLGLQKPVSYRFCRNFYIVDHPSGSSRVEWSKLVRVVVIKSAFLFYATTQLAHIVPKKAFTQKEDLEMLMGILNEKKSEGLKVKGLKRKL